MVNVGDRVVQAGEDGKPSVVVEVVARPDLCWRGDAECPAPQPALLRTCGDCGWFRGDTCPLRGEL